MADLEHDVLTTSEVHEPKHITGNGTAASGKVITNSSTVAGTSEYRSLKSGDITEVDVYIGGYERDSTIAEDTLFIIPVNGTLVNVSAVISDALVTGDNVYTIDINGTAPTPSTLTVVQAGSATGDIATVTLTANNGVTAGTAVKLSNNGGNSDAAVGTWFQLRFRRA